MEESENFEGFDYWDITQFGQLDYLRKRQRLCCRGTLSGLPEPLRHYLYACPLSYLPRRYDSRMMDSLTISPVGVGQAQRRKRGYLYGKFPSANEMIEAAQDMGDKHDSQEAYLWMGSGNPFLVVPIGWARQHLSELQNACLSDLCLLTQDLKVGLVMTRVDRHCHKIPATGNICYVPRSGKRVEAPWVLGVWGY